MRSKRNEVTNQRKVEAMRKLSKACNTAIKAGRAKKAILNPQ
jgi:hypothetical protein